MIFEDFVFSTVYIQHLFSGVHPWRVNSRRVSTECYNIAVTVIITNWVQAANLLNNFFIISKHYWKCRNSKIFVYSR